MQIKWFVGMVLAVGMASAAIADEIQIEALGIRIEPISRGFSRIIAVKEWGPAWRADLAAGDIVRNDAEVLHELGTTLDQVFAMIPTRSIGMRASSLFKLNEGHGTDLMRAPFTKVQLTSYPFDETGRWFTDPVRPSDRAREEPGLEARITAARNFIDASAAQISSMPCAEGRLSPDSEKETRTLGYHADGLIFAAAGQVPDDQAIDRATSDRNFACIRGEDQDLEGQRLNEFLAAQGAPETDLLEFPELGLRLRPTTLTFPDGKGIPALQVHSHQEFSPIWQSSTIMPGDFIAGTAESFRRNLDSVLKLKARRPAGSIVHFEPQFYLLSAKTEYDRPQIDVSMEMVDFDRTGRWFSDRLTGYGRAREMAGLGDVEKFDVALDTMRQKIRSLGCGATGTIMNREGALLDGLHIAAGKGRSAYGHAGELGRIRDVFCERERSGDVSEEQLTRLAALQARRCDELTDLSERTEQLDWEITQINYPSVSQSSISNLFGRQVGLEDGGIELQGCISEWIATEFRR